jgi:hypothetical protein
MSHTKTIPDSTDPTPLHGTRNVEQKTDPFGAHPTELGVLDGVTVGLGVVSGAVTGMAAGALAGPVGMVAGAMIGGVAGGFAGKEAGKFIDPTTDDAWLKSEFAKRPYENPDETFEDFAQSYRFGARAEASHAGQTFSEAEADVKREYELTDRNRLHPWGQAKPALASSFTRMRQLRQERDALPNA